MNDAPPLLQPPARSQGARRADPHQLTLATTIPALLGIALLGSLLGGCGDGPSTEEGSQPPPAELPSAADSGRDEETSRPEIETSPGARADDPPAVATPLLGADVLALFDGHPEARATHERAAAFHAVGNARESLPLLTRLQSDEPRPWDQLTGILLVDGLAQVNSLVEATSRLAAYRARWGVDSYPVCQALIEARLERRRGLQKQQASRSDAVGLEDYRSALGHLAGPLDDPLCGPDALYLRGILERTVGDRTAAYRTLEQMAERFPDAPRSPHALRVAAEEARRMADVSGARALLERHVENYPDHAATRAVRSQLRELGRWNETAPEVRIEKWITPGTLPGAADAKGHLLVFFATWCPRCQSEADEVEALHARYVGQGLEVVALTRHTRGQDDAAVEDFVTEHSLTHPVAIDAGGTQESYGIRRLPTAVWVAADGRAVWRGAPSELLPEVAARLLSNVN